MAEAFALLMFLSHASLPPYSFLSDCSWVVESFGKGRWETTGSQHVGADVWSRIWDRVDDLGGVLAVAAHRTS